MNTFKHSGDIGDIILSLPVIRHFGGGVLYIEAANYTRQRLTPDKWCGLDLLLKQQPYIVDVLPWRGERVSANLNDFRANMQRVLRRGEGKQKALVDWMLEAHGAPSEAKNEPWLKVEPKVIASVVFSRSGAGRPAHQVYQNSNFPWHRVWRKYHEHSVFIGLEEEYRVFCGTCGETSHYVTKDLLEAAHVIAGCELFVGNQNACHAIAEGMKKNILLEVWREGPNCLHFRPGVTHGWSLDVNLPDL